MSQLRLREAREVELARKTPRGRNRASASSVRARGATRRGDCARAVISSGEGQAETRDARDGRASAREEDAGEGDGDAIDARLGLAE